MTARGGLLKTGSSCDLDGGSSPNGFGGGRRAATRTREASALTTSQAGFATLPRVRAAAPRSSERAGGGARAGGQEHERNDEVLQSQAGAQYVHARRNRLRRNRRRDTFVVHLQPSSGAQGLLRTPIGFSTATIFALRAPRSAKCDGFALSRRPPSRDKGHKTRGSPRPRSANNFAPSWRL